MNYINGNKGWNRTVVKIGNNNLWITLMSIKVEIKD